MRACLCGRISFISFCFYRRAAFSRIFFLVVALFWFLTKWRFLFKSSFLGFHCFFCLTEFSLLFALLTRLSFLDYFLIFSSDLLVNWLFCLRFAIFCFLRSFELFGCAQNFGFIFDFLIDFGGFFFVSFFSCFSRWLRDRRFSRSSVGLIF